MRGWLKLERKNTYKYTSLTPHSIDTRDNKANMNQWMNEWMNVCSKISIWFYERKKKLCMNEWASKRMNEWIRDGQKLRNRFMEIVSIQHHPRFFQNTKPTKKIRQKCI